MRRQAKRASLEVVRRDVKCRRCGLLLRRADVDERMQLCRWCLQDLTGYVPRVEPDSVELP